MSRAGRSENGSEVDSMSEAITGVNSPTQCSQIVYREMDLANAKFKCGKAEGQVITHYFVTDGINMWSARR